MVKYIKDQALGKEESPIEFNPELEKTLEGREGLDFLSGSDDPLFDEARKLVFEAKKASASLLQRRLRVGYARAARLIDMLEEKGIVGPGEGAKPREILVNTGDMGMGAGTAETGTAEIGEETNDDWKKI